MCKSTKSNILLSLKKLVKFDASEAIKHFIFVLSIIGIANSAYAQSNQINGLINDAISKEPLPGAYILIKNSDSGTVSGMDGKFVIEASTNDTLVFSFIGYIAQEIVVGNQTSINVSLKEDFKQLDEIIVIGYGSIRKSDLTGAISSIKNEELIKIPASSVEQALQGKVTGVQVTSASGQPGQPPVVRIRGVGTTNNASPLFVVDGVFLDDISFLGAEDISSLEVLKDASSTAIYGSRGANGVIIITTKKGVKNSGKPQLKFSSTLSLQSLERQISLLDGSQFATYVNELIPGTFNNINALPNTNWQNEIFSNAPLQNHQISLTGGGKRVSYYISTSLFKQQGIIPKSSFERFNIKLNNTYQVANNLEIGNNITLSNIKQEFAPDVVAMTYRAWPVDSPFNADGTFGEVNGAGNPLAALEYANNNAKSIRGVGNVYINYTFLNHFSFKSSFGFDLQQRNTKNFTPVFFVSPTQQNPENSLFVGNTTSSTWVWENIVNYSKEVNNHRLDLLAGYTLQKSQWEALNATVLNLIRETPDFWYIDAGERATQTASNTANRNTLVSYLFRANYVLSDTYLFTATYRIDGSSKFGNNNKFAQFPAFAVGWLASEEAFIKSINFLSFFKIRASWGIIGNEKIDQNARFPLVINGVDGVFGNPEATQQGATLGNTANPNLRWESTEQIDIGLEVGIWGDKLFGEFGYYNRKTSDILVNLAVPGFYGNGPFVRVTTNAAEVQNTGFEFNLNWQEQKNNFSYSIGLLGTTVNNKVLSLGSQQDAFIAAGSLGNGQLVTHTKVGHPIGAFYGYQTDGVFQNLDELNNSAIAAGQLVGDLKYIDQNNDGTINSEDRVIIGSSIPSFIYGVSFSSRYKQIDISIDIQGQSGNQIYNGKNAVRPNLQNYETRVLDRWTGEGTSNSEPRSSSGGVNFVPSTYFLENGDFIRLRSVSLGFNFSQAMLDKIKLNQLRIFLSGTNLITLTKYSGYTPEIGGENVLSNGIDLGIYPITSVYSMGFIISL